MKIKDWDINYYLVAYLDVLGQKENILKVEKLPTTVEEKDKCYHILEKTAGYVNGLRQTFSTIFETMARPTDVLNGLTPNQRTEFLKLREFDLIFRGVSDSLIFTVPIDDADSCKSIQGIYAALGAICGTFSFALQNGKPFRGGVDIGWGVPLPIAPNEVYGSALVKAYSLENNIAQYPRVVIGDSLWNYINEVETVIPESLRNNMAIMIASRCKGFITSDYDHLHILDVIGEEVKSMGGLESDWVKIGYEYVVGKCKKLNAEGNMKLGSRYGWLKSYLESRLHLWSITTHG